MRNYRRILVVLLLFVAGVLMVKPLARLFYPMPYREKIFFYARQNGLDPLLVLALIRTESKFYPLAVSATGARGLMQLMPETAEWVAGKMGLQFNVERLFEPDYNLRLGTWYLAHILREFKGNLPATLAAYNAGSEKVKEWLDGGVWSGSTADLHRVPFPETREFVRQVLRNYSVYRWLY
ncbi:MAG: lytic transglycosylase domain-containing protein [Thermanaeromonas sp.]|uniref:lytic transglycosylase domain-containing protein n=1 Tax=Thermanaeromonas sp. TaxID=2003697 RepID=UPI002440017A|nr:lytic transglycosylase domain-containing protein [Thermanaeromonas sp.]MCG0277762.1 lytic transglycosylase domain-containing protein [Thermanaeromonas sp.]